MGYFIDETPRESLDLAPDLIVLGYMYLRSGYIVEISRHYPFSDISFLAAPMCPFEFILPNEPMKLRMMWA